MLSCAKSMADRSPPVRRSAPCSHSQIRLRNQRRLQTAIRSARLPAVKTLGDLDFRFQPSIKREKLEICSR